MNQILHTVCHSPRVKMILTSAVFGGAMCVACAAVTLADELLEPSSSDRASANRPTRLSADTSGPPTRLRLPQLSVDLPSLSVNSPARWADLSPYESTVLADAVNSSGVDFDGLLSARSNVSVSVHVGPAPSAFIPESFLGARHLSAAPMPQPLRPSRLPPTGYFDELMPNTRIATGPHDSRSPLNLLSQ